MSTVSDTLSRDAAEQRIMEILYPPAGLIPNSREERAKVPRIMEAIDHLFAVVDGEELVKVYRGSDESRAITERALRLKKEGKTEADIAAILGLSLSAVHNRIGRALYGPQRSQTANSPGAPVGQENSWNPYDNGRIVIGKKPVPQQEDIRINSLQGSLQNVSVRFGLPKPAELRSAADHIAEANEKVGDADPTEAQISGPVRTSPDATLRNVADHFRDGTEMVGDADPVGAQPEIEQVSGPAAALQEEPKPAENPTLRESRIVEESKTVQAAKKLPKIPHGEDDFILSERAVGKKFREIHDSLAAKGITCTLDDVIARFHQVNGCRKQEEKKKQEELPIPKPEQPKAAKPTTEDERYQTLLDMKIERLSYTNTTTQIAEKLSCPGNVWTEDMVLERQKKIHGGKA